MPLPMPLTVLPNISWAKEFDENCRMAPTALIAAPTRRVFLRPSLSLKSAATMHPRRFPSENMLVNVPSRTGFLIWGNRFTKRSLTKMPAMIPWSYPYHAWAAELTVVNATSKA